MSRRPTITVIIPTHNPNADRLRRTLAGLAAQTLPKDDWELLLIDNASAVAVDDAVLAAHGLANGRIVREPKLGLTAARLRGFSDAAADIAILVDDDNVLTPTYLEGTVRRFGQHPRVGAAGGRSLPEFECPVPPDLTPFVPLLAVRDLGDREQLCSGTRKGRLTYPTCAPIGAGMAVRRPAWQAWSHAPTANISDRRGRDLTSGGDNDIVLALLRDGWDVAYFPELVLTHLIPGTRLEPEYLARLNRGIQRSWVAVLLAHGASPWPPLHRWGAILRKAKAWLAYQPWTSRAARIRWQGACGHFEGRVKG